jgi:DNA invertase Pin-like site-specific DNA recombinase
MNKCYAYLRVSTSGQIDGDGFDRQMDTITNFAQQHGWAIDAIYKEEGVSGSLEERPQLARLMVDLERNGIKTVIIERLERLARDLMVQEAIIRDFKQNGFDLISAIEGPDLASNDPTRKLIRQVFGAIAEYDKSMLVLKLKAARDRVRARKGRCEGPRPYGHNLEEAKILKRVRYARRKPKGHGKRKTLQTIADELNADGLRTRQGKKWSPASIHNILKKGKAQK